MLLAPPSSTLHGPQPRALPVCIDTQMLLFTQLLHTICHTVCLALHPWGNPCVLLGLENVCYLLRC